MESLDKLPLTVQFEIAKLKATLPLMSREQLENFVYTILVSYFAMHEMAKDLIIKSLLEMGFTNRYEPSYYPLTANSMQFDNLLYIRIKSGLSFDRRAVAISIMTNLNARVSSQDILLGYNLITSK